MGVRGEMFSTKVSLDNRTYFFNVKENRKGDVFMTVVESKPSEGEGFDRHQIVLFADDTREFLKGFEAALGFVEKELAKRRKQGRERLSAERRAAEDRPAQTGADKGHQGPGRDGARASYARKPARPGAPPRDNDGAPKGPPRGKKKATVRTFKPEPRD